MRIVEAARVAWRYFSIGQRSCSLGDRMHAAKATKRRSLARGPEHARCSSEPSGTAHVAATAHDAERSGGRSLGIDFTSRWIVSCPERVDRVGHPFLDVAGHVVDAVTRAPERKRSNWRELGVAVAVVVLLQRGRAVIAGAFVEQISPGKTAAGSSARRPLPLGFGRKAPPREPTVRIGVVPGNQRYRILRAIQALTACCVSRRGAAPELDAAPVGGNGHLGTIDVISGQCDIVHLELPREVPFAVLFAVRLLLAQSDRILDLGAVRTHREGAGGNEDLRRSSGSERDDRTLAPGRQNRKGGQPFDRWWQSLAVRDGRQRGEPKQGGCAWSHGEPQKTSIWVGRSIRLRSSARNLAPTAPSTTRWSHDSVIARRW